MTQTQLTGIIGMLVFFVILAVLVYCTNNYSLNGIKRKTSSPTNAIEDFK